MTPLRRFAKDSAIEDLTFLSTILVARKRKILGILSQRVCVDVLDDVFALSFTCLEA
jgi:hypothetical protein